MAKFEFINETETNEFVNARFARDGGGYHQPAFLFFEEKTNNTYLVYVLDQGAFGIHYMVGAKYGRNENWIDVYRGMMEIDHAKRIELIVLANIKHLFKEGKHFELIDTYAAGMAEHYHVLRVDDNYYVVSDTLGGVAITFRGKEEDCFEEARALSSF